MQNKLSDQLFIGTIVIPTPLTNVGLYGSIYTINTYWQEYKYVKLQYDLEINKWSYSIATNLTAIELSNLIQESERRNFSISVLRPP